MINLLLSVLGAVLLIVGFYTMYLGFSTPPNFTSFFVGLCVAIIGLLTLGYFGTRSRTTEKKELSTESEDYKSKKSDLEMKREEKNDFTQEKMLREIKNYQVENTKVPTIETVEKAKSEQISDKEFVMRRLDRLKRNYIDADEVEYLIDQRLESFRKILEKKRSESKETFIIWSFDSDDVEETMKDAILKSKSRILLMYPWLRNIEVDVLQKFLELECRMIVQEASLDDDVSVEIIKLLMDNNVKIRTFQHVHTAAVVSDKKQGLIISVDPIYDGFEVGMVYHNPEIVSEIERLFEDVWKISDEIKLV
jgi:hypothetical protein